MPAAEVPPDDPDQLEPLDEPDTGVGLEVFPALGNEGRLTLVDCVSEAGRLGAAELSVLGKFTVEVELTGAALFPIGLLSWLVGSVGAGDVGASEDIPESACSDVVDVPASESFDDSAVEPSARDWVSSNGMVSGEASAATEAKEPSAITAEPIFGNMLGPRSSITYFFLAIRKPFDSFR